MNWPKVKTLLILVLLLANLLLGGVYLARGWETERVGEQARRDLLAALQSAGVTLNIDLPDTRAATLYFQRRPEDEAALAATLLGSCEIFDLGGHITEYASAQGSARFRSGGQFEVTFTPPAALLAASPQDDLRQRAVSQGLPAVDSPPLSRADGEGLILSLFLAAQGLPLWGAPLEARYEDSALCALSGRYLSGEPLPGEEGDCPPAGAALLRLAGFRGNGFAVDTMELGYLLDTPSPNVVRLTPVWRVRAGGAVLYADAYTGRPVTV